MPTLQSGAQFVCVIVLNWNGRRLLRTCLESIFSRTSYPNFEVIVVDNASTDGSVDMVISKFPMAKLIVNPENLGFAGGNNRGIEWGLQRGAQYVLLLNNDVEIIVAGMVVVSLVFTILSPDIFLTWRGLFILPLYLTGALGAASVIRRVNRFGASPDKRTQLAFAATFSVYLFLSLLCYSLRAIELLIWESHF